MGVVFHVYYAEENSSGLISMYTLQQEQNSGFTDT